MLGGIAFHADDSVFHFQLVGGNAQASCGQLQEQEPSRGGGIAQRLSALSDGSAATNAALIGRLSGITHDEGHARGRDVEFFGDDLAVGGFDAHADFGFSGEHPDGFVFFDAQPRIEARGRRRGGCSLRRHGGR